MLKNFRILILGWLKAKMRELIWIYTINAFMPALNRMFLFQVWSLAIFIFGCYIWFCLSYQLCFPIQDVSTFSKNLMRRLHGKLVLIMTFLFSEKDSTKSETNESQTTVDVCGLVQLNSATQDKLLHQCPQGQLVVILLSDATSTSEARRSPIVQIFANVSRSYQK
jgi:hypothetical protein